MVFAADDATQSFTLDQMVVTATRYEKPDLEVAAATEVLTKEDLEKSGARSGDIEPRRFEDKDLVGRGDSNRILKEC